MERALTFSSMPLGLYTEPSGTKWVPSGTKRYQVGIVAAMHAAMCLGVQAAIEGHAAMVQLLIDAGGCSVCIT